MTSASTCDQLLADQDVLVCGADRLLSIADAVAPVTLALEKNYYTLTFPPQADHDKFILRDAATTLLGLATHLEFIAPAAQGSTAFPYTSCTDGYLNLLGSLTADQQTDAQNFLFGASAPSNYLPPEQVPCLGTTTTGCDAAADVGKARLEYKVHVLRAGSRVLRQILDESVHADMAGAEQQRANAGGTTGQQLMWGLGDPDGNPYNSLRHAAAVIFGRVEQANTGGVSSTWDPQYPLYDPACNGYKAIVTGYERNTTPADQDLLDAIGPGFSARWDDLPAATDGQALATSIVTNLGLVMAPDEHSVAAGPPAALADLVVKRAAQEQGLLDANFNPAPGFTSADVATFDAGPIAAARLAVLSQISPADIDFGISRAWDAYRLLTDFPDIPDSFPTGGLDGFLELAATTAGLPVAASSPVVLGGAIPRSDLFRDPLITMSPAAAASECAEYVPDGFDFTDPEVGQVSTFTNAFSLGDIMRRRIALIRDRSVTPLGTGNDLYQLGDLADAEIRGWAAQGRAYLQVVDPSTYKYEVVITGMTSDWIDIDSTTLSSLGDRLTLVAGRTLDAECVAGDRDNCPSTSQQATLDAAVPPVFRAPKDPADVGNDGGALEAHFVFSSAPPSAGVYDGSLYLVLKADPRSPQTKGRLLATFPPFPAGVAAGTSTSAPISDYQAQLAGDAFGLTEAQRTEERCVGDDTTTSPKGYCVDGIDRDFFVPLDNELTSDQGAEADTESSWKHYLSLAQEAASEADELGNQVIQEGLQEDMRREDAEEELGQMCGDFVGAASLAVTNGVPSVPQDESGSSCMNEPTTDLVFLGHDPFGDATTMLTGENLAAVQKVFCAAGSTKGFCGKTSISVAALGLGNAASKTTPPDTCSTILQLASSPPTFTGLAQEALSSYATKDSLSTALLNLKFSQNLDTQWLVALRGKLIMGFVPGLDPVSHPAPTSTTSWSPPLDPEQVFPLCRNLPRTNGSCTTNADCGNGSGLCEKFSDGTGYCSRCKGVALSLESLYPNPVVVGTDAQQQIQFGVRMQRALYYMGALSGTLPQGTFTIPVPAGNYASPHAPSAGFAPAVVYGASNFVSTGSTWSLAATAPDKDIPYFTGSVAVPSQYASMLSANLGPGAPSWYQNLVTDLNATQSTPGVYVLTAASNSAVTFPAFTESGSTLQLSELINDIGGSGVSMQSILADERYPVGDYAAGSDLGFNPLWRVGLHGTCMHTAPVFAEDNDDGERGVDMFNAFDPVVRATVPVGGDPYSATVPQVVFDGFAYVAPLNLLVSSGYSDFVDHSSSAQFVPDEYLCGATALLSQYCSTNFLAPSEPTVAVDTDGVTAPSWCSPEDRVPLFVDHWPASTSTGEKAVLADVLALSCIVNGGATSGQVATPPSQTLTVADLAQLGQWTKQIGAAANTAVDALYLENVPTSVVQDFVSGAVADVGVTDEGQHGTDLLNIRGALEQVYTGWTNMSSNISQLGSALDSASESLQLNQAQLQTQLLDIDSTEASLDKELALSSLSAMASTMSGITGVADRVISGAAVGASVGPWGAIAGGVVGLFSAASSVDVADQSQAISQQYADRVRANDQALENTDQVAAQVQEQKTFTDLSGTTTQLHANIQNALSQMKTSTAAALSAIAKLRDDEGQARQQAAQAAGADFYRASDGSIVELPVNTVLNRQYDVTQRRYQDALKRARQLAYTARVAIEERIGVRLNALQSPVGPLAAPALWADDVCSLQGINYDALRDTTPLADGGVSAPAPNVDPSTGQFVDEYIGDYVNKLSDFMNFYNIQYPFHEADDRAVISLKDQLLSPGTGCSVVSKNLLFFSDALYQHPTGTIPAQSGWEVHACDSGDAGSTSCLEVVPVPANLAATTPALVADGGSGAGTSAATGLMPPGGSGGVSWLRTVASGTAGVPVGPQSSLPSPPDSVYQGVSLDAQGNYVLSWWDMSLSSTGQATKTTTPYNYQASIYDSSWHLVAVQPVVSTAGTGYDAGSGQWSARRTLSFVTPVADTYYVAFEMPNAAAGANVAIANVQLQVSTTNAGFASGYESTGSTRTVFSTACGDQPGAIQNAFDYRCEGNQCFYELKAPFAIDVTAIDSGASALTGAIGAGNYNHRHLTMAVNIVGTGVLDCTKNPTPACYSTAYIDYDLSHDAYNVPMIDYGGQPRCFTFGTGNINSGKAIAAERYITFPISSADESLVGQDGILRTEFAGRPLGGTYRLRIIDNPALNWQAVQDIQFILGYRVWSRVTQTGTN